MERIHIFVPVYFREQTVRRAVESLIQTCSSDGYEVRVILVDNRSNKSLRSFLRETESKHNDIVSTIFFKQNKGKAAAINNAVKKFADFQWFVNYDSDILSMTPQWPRILVECHKRIEKAGMISPNYIQNGNHPMPKQPNKMGVWIGDTKHVFNYGGQVAGGCFLCDRWTWNHTGGYRASGVYGGVDGLFRQTVADILKRHCGYIEDVMVEHLDDRSQNQGYHTWKIGVQSNIKKFGPTASSEKLGNAKGYFDDSKTPEK